MRAGCWTIEYGLARYGYGERTEMGGHVVGCGQSEYRQAPDILSRNLHPLGLRYKIPGIDFKAGAGMFPAVAFVESIPRGKLTSNESPWGNHEPWRAWILACGTRKKNSPSKPNELLSLRFSCAMYGPD